MRHSRVAAKEPRKAAASCVRSIVGVLAIGLPGASAQERIYKWFGDQSQEAFGNSLTTIGDVTGDGVPDVIVGAPSASTDFGMLRAFSGRDGSIAWSLFGTAGEALGLAVTSIGDVDLDGMDDFVAVGVKIVVASSTFTQPPRLREFLQAS